MRISTKGRYGLRFMLDIAEHSDSGNVKLKDIAHRQAISEKYLWQVITPLKAAGMINSSLGPNGGYSLAKAPTDITLHDILAVLEGDCTLVHCVRKPTVCSRSETCATREIWRELNGKIAELMESLTLKDMLENDKKKAGDSPLTYCI